MRERTKKVHQGLRLMGRGRHGHSRHHQCPSRRIQSRPNRLPLPQNPRQPQHQHLNQHPLPPPPNRHNPKPRMGRPHRPILPHPRSPIHSHPSRRLSLDGRRTPQPRAVDCAFPFCSTGGASVGDCGVSHWEAEVGGLFRYCGAGRGGD